MLLAAFNVSDRRKEDKLFWHKLCNFRQIETKKCSVSVTLTWRVGSGEVGVL